MKIVFVVKEPHSTVIGESHSQGTMQKDPVWYKAQGLAERGHEVWVLSPGSLTGTSGQVGGVVQIGPSRAILSGHEGMPSATKPWSSVVADALLRLHHEHAIDIIDIPLDSTGICSDLSAASGRERMPAIVQIGEEPQGQAPVCEARVPLYRFVGELSFSPSNAIESHIAILRLENFFHGVLNRHYAAHQPAA